MTRLILWNMLSRYVDEKKNRIIFDPSKLSSDLPLNSAAGLSVTSGFRHVLWNDLYHPPLS
jgi:hypothetical protein